jgi:serine/threonine-protein kinase
MVTGRPPFTGTRPVEVAWQHCYAEPRPPSTLRPDLPGTVEAVILTALAKSPDERYEDALQMRAALLSALEDAGSQDTAPAVDGVAHDTVTQDPLLTTLRAVQTYAPGARIDWEAVEAADLGGAGDDRRRERVGMAIIVLGLALLAVVVLIAMGTP